MFSGGRERFSDVFRGYGKKPVASNQLMNCCIQSCSTITKYEVTKSWQVYLGLFQTSMMKPFCDKK